MRELLLRRWKSVVFVVALAIAIAFAYKPANQFRRFFLTDCAADGPVRETELDIDPEPVDLMRYYDALHEAAAGLDVKVIAYAEYRGERWPILLFGSSVTPTTKPVLVVAGIHGNEVSGSLAAAELVSSIRNASRSGALYVLAPANPIGLKYGSRYNASGCDINRDFREYRTLEARAIRSAVQQVKPVAVVSLHEGPQDGIFVIGTQMTSETLIRSMASAMEERRFPLATKNNLGMTLEQPGTMIEGGFMTRAKSWLGIYSLGEHTSELGIPLVTTEAPWRGLPMKQRIEMHAIAVEVALAHARASERQ